MCSRAQCPCPLAQDLQVVSPAANVIVIVARCFVLQDSSGLNNRVFAGFHGYFLIYRQVLPTALMLPRATTVLLTHLHDASVAVDKACSESREW